MNEKYLICEEGLRNVVQDGKKVGWEFWLRIPYYAGVPLSMIDHLKVTIDGEAVSEEAIRFNTSCGEVFTLQELETVTTYRWEYGEKARITVLQDGGLAPGRHKLEVDVALRIIYMPKGNSSYAWAEFDVE